ncbi:MAG: oxaloacetate decarboxylase, partial [Magnetococcales bacterium]|nr:oxaloacetate decarboxylase [Magnetococcales bacterium]
KDLGNIALVTPTSQIVGTQAVFNVMMGERYKSITKETRGILRGEYGSTPAPMNKELQSRVLEDGEEPLTCRPADKLKPEVDKLSAELEKIVKEKSVRRADAFIDDVLTYALFPAVGLKFLENRDNPDAFEPFPSVDDVAPAKAAKAAEPAKSAPSAVENYRVVVNGAAYDVEVGPGGAVSQATPAAAAPAAAPVPAPAASGGGEAVPAPLAGNVVRVDVHVGSQVNEGDVIVIVEAMKMETEVRAPRSGAVASIAVKAGDTVAVGDPLLTLN